MEKSYDDYEFHIIYHAVHNFCSVEISSFYIDVLKDMLYISPPRSLARRSAQTAMYRILDALTRLVAPVLSFTAEEIWQYLPGEREESVHLARFPRFENSLIDSALNERYRQLLAIRSDVSKALELARNSKLVGHSLDARVLLEAPAGPVAALLEEYRDELASLFIVSQAELSSNLEGFQAGEAVPGLKIRIEKAQGDKCERCWNYSVTVGADESHPSACERCREALAAS
ncbi:MAG: class I tRNA ligase family protein [Syntrophotaleaceae bacterium]